MLGSGSGQGRLSQESAAVQIAAAAGFFLPFLLIAVVLVKFTPFSFFLSLMIAAICGAIVSRLAERITRAKLLLAEEAARKAVRDERKAETQKQIDAMQKANSNIPKVKK